MHESVVAVRDAIVELECDAVEDCVKTCLAAGISPLQIIEDGVSRGLELVGQRFDEGEYFLADLVLAGDMVGEAMELLKDGLDTSDTGRKGQVIMATVEGDIHEIGKNIVVMLLEAHGYEVVDLGVDVPAQRIVEAASKDGVRLVGLSVLLSTMVGKIREVVDSLAAAGLDDTRVVIGGACTSEDLCAEMGAHGYGATAVQAVRIFDQLSAAGA